MKHAGQVRPEKQSCGREGLQMQQSKFYGGKKDEPAGLVEEEAGQSDGLSPLNFHKNDLIVITQTTHNTKFIFNLFLLYNNKTIWMCWLLCFIVPIVR